ncbi:MAG: TolC family protein, partial [Acidiferrobacterales bacterium]
ALVAEVARSYVLIRTFEERIAIAEQNAVTQERALRIAEVKFRNGAVTELDVQQAKTILNNTESQIPQFQINLRQAKNALSVLLGMPPRDLKDALEGPAPIPTPPPQVAVGMPQDLIRRRPDLRRAERTLAAQSAQVGVAVSDLYPHFSLGGAIGLSTSDINGKNFGDLFDSKSLGGLLFGAFKWDVFNYGRLKNNVRVQDARFQRLLVDYQDTVLRAQAEVEDAIVAYLRSHEQARFLGDSARAAQRSVELSFLQYREGTTDFNRVLTTMTALAGQQEALTSTTGTIATNLVSLYKALGGGWVIGVKRDPNDFVPEETKEEMRERTKYWKKALPVSTDKAPKWGPK